MKTKIDRELVKVVFCDLMVWSTIPILISGGLWETSLAISETSHILVQLMLLLGIYGWAWFWFSSGERCRLRNLTTCSDNVQPEHVAKMTSQHAVEHNYLQKHL